MYSEHQRPSRLCLRSPRIRGACSVSSFYTGVGDPKSASILLNRPLPPPLFVTVFIGVKLEKLCDSHFLQQNSLNCNHITSSHKISIIIRNSKPKSWLYHPWSSKCLSPYLFSLFKPFFLFFMALKWYREINNSKQSCDLTNLACHSPEIIGSLLFQTQFRWENQIEVPCF